MNTLKLIILLVLPMIFFGGFASAQTAIGTANAGAITGASGFSGQEFISRTGFSNTLFPSERAAIARVGLGNGGFPADTRYQTGFSVRPGGPPQSAGPPANSTPGTNSVGTFGSGQTTVTNPSNPFTVATPGATKIVVGATGETGAVTPGTSGTGQPAACSGDNHRD